MTNVTFNNIKPNQTIWIVNPYYVPSVKKYKTLSSAYLRNPKYGFYAFDAFLPDSPERTDNIYFNDSTLIKMFYSEVEAKRYFLEITNNNTFIEYDKIRLKEYNLSIERGRNICSLEHKQLEKLVFKHYKPQNFELPKAI